MRPTWQRVTAADPARGATRVLPRLIVCLGIGLTATVAIALILLWHSTQVHPPWHEQPNGSMVARTPGVVRTLAAIAAEPGEPQAVVTTTAGWPLPTLVKRSTYPLYEPPQQGLVAIRPRYMAVEESLRQWWRYRPTWGLAVTTISLSMLILGFWQGLHRARRRTSARESETSE